MREADLSNRKTNEAGHNNSTIDELTSGFENQRKALVNKLKGLNEENLNEISLHPRLKTPMRIIDLCYFVAEHDDHHLAQINILLNK